MDGQINVGHINLIGRLVTQSLSSLNLIGQTVFELESGKRKCGQTDGWTGKRTNEQTKFRQEPSYDGGLCPCQVWIRLDKPFSSWSLETKMWMDRWIDRQTDKKTDKQTDGITPISKGT